MKQTTYFKNPGPGPSRATTPTGTANEPAGTSPTTMAAIDGKKISGLVQTGSAVIGGQVAATILTNMGLNALGERAAPGSMIRKAGVVAGPMVLGAAIMGFSKNARVQEAGIGCLAAGVAAGVAQLLPSQVQEFGFYPVAGSPVMDMGYTADGYASQLMLEAGRDLDALYAGGGAGYGAAPAQEVRFVEMSQIS